MGVGGSGFPLSRTVTYQKLARQLDEKRKDRETYIDEVVRILLAELTSARIAADVSGRPKHIYSIWRKMQRKGVGLNDLFDVRAVRVLVDNVKDCYAVLGIVHNLWTPIPREFDDYIARPKANDYRSLHTAVVGPDSRVLEVQVRTNEMHQHAELGVAAHWRYKESVKSDRSLDDKISWLRNVLEWKDELTDASELAEYFKTDLFQDMVYVVTPQGRVVDLPRGSTPVDFAYQLHTELGHRCRGAKVNGHIVPLTHALSNGQRVEIIAAKEGGPSRDWLNPTLGYIKSNRSRTKVRQWFNVQQLDAAIAHGRAVLEKDLQRLGKTGQNLEALASRLGLSDVNELFAALGRGDVTPRQVQAAVLGEEIPKDKSSVPQAPALPTTAPEGILIVGVDKLLTMLARCCKPAPPDPIMGFVTRGRGVTVHRADCSNVARLPQERLIAADWGKTGASKFPVDIEIIAGGNPGLMRDILDVFTREKVRVASSTSFSEELNAKMAFTLEVEGLPQLARILVQVRDISGVASARRR
jgi:GTP pyrophosphokinase